MTPCDIYEKHGVKFCDTNHLECSNCEIPLEHYEKTVESKMTDWEKACKNVKNYIVKNFLEAEGLFSIREPKLKSKLGSRHCPLALPSSPAL